MRPIKLTMSAFGSYAGKQEIVFDKNDEKLFLITGDTGAGKTTVFDAICFALYGEMSGENRQGKMMRSDFAMPEQKTYVEFIFEDKNAFYKVIRNPEYYRKSKRKKKKENGSSEYSSVKETAKAELYFLEGTEETLFSGNMRETNAKLVELLGLDLGQFTQIAMLAQGEFMKLLISPTDQKKEIFQKLFHTQKYRQIIKLMGERKKEKESDLLKNKTECEMILQETDCEKTSQYQEAFFACKQSYFLHPEEFLAVLASIINEDGTAILALENELQDLKDKSDRLLLEIHQTEETNRLFQNLFRAEEKKAYWEKEEKESEKKEIRLKQAEQAEPVIEKKTALDETEKKKRNKETQIEKKKQEWEQTKAENQKALERFSAAEREKKEKEEPLKKEILEIERNLPRYDEIEAITKKRKQQEQKRDILNHKIEELKKKIQSQENDCSEREQKQLMIEEQLRELPEKEALLLQITKTLLSYEDLKKETEKIPELLKKQDESQRAFLKAETEFKEKSRLYEDMVIKFTDGQAGLMAEQLRQNPGMPCPVCGNTEYQYPLLAPLKLNIPTQEQVKRTKKKRDDAEHAMQETAETAGLDKHSYDRQYLLCQERYRQLTGNDTEFFPDTENLAKINTTISELKQKKKSIEAEKKKLKTMEQEGEEQKETIQKIKQEIERERISMENTKEEQETNNQELFQLQAAEELQKKELIYHSRKEADLQLQKRKKMLTTILDIYQELQESLTILSRKLLQQETELHAMQEEQTTLAAEAEEKRKLYNRTWQEEGFSSEREWQAAVADKEQKTAWKREIEQIKKEAALAGQSVFELKKQLKGKEQKDGTKQKELLKRKKEAIDLLSQKEQRIKFQQKKNQAAWEKLTKRKTDQEMLTREYMQIKTLYEVANGTLTGAVKIDIETFVLRHYMKQVLKAANRRFLTMSGGQFELRLKEGKEFDQRSNQGLDFSVYSLLSNTNRDIKTLSGGETFMAALSMALGMADIVQNMAGSIHLDMMFIDEGFGSLDEVSRQQAVQVLQELSGGKRMIGIISHVTELKEQITQKLIIEKTENGSRAHWE